MPPPQFPDWNWLLQTLMGIQKTVWELSQAVAASTGRVDRLEEKVERIDQKVDRLDRKVDRDHPYNLCGDRRVDCHRRSGAPGPECGQRRNRCARGGSVAAIGGLGRALQVTLGASQGRYHDASQSGRVSREYNLRARQGIWRRTRQC